MRSATGTRLWLALRQARHVRAHRDAVPEAFAAAIPIESHRKAADYTVAKVRLGIVDALLDAVILVALTLGGVLQWLIDLWARALQEVPDSRLLLSWPTLGDAHERERLSSLFTARGIRAERLELRRGAPSHAGVLAEYGEVDLALDPFPFSGCLTTCEALWMGVPVVTLPRTRPASRQSQAFLTALGRTEWVARNEDDYLRIAADLQARTDWHRVAPKL